MHWADIVDGALYESAEAAVEMAAPAMKLTLIIEATAGPGADPADDSAADAKSRWPQVLEQPFMRRCCRRCWSGTRRAWS